MTIVEQILGSLRARQAKLAEDALSPQISDWLTYKNIIAHRRGLQEAIEIVKEVVSEYDDDDI